MIIDNNFIHQYQPLVYNIVRQYRHIVQAERSCAALEVEDLVQEGMLGLLTAAQRFDSNISANFTAYAAHWIRKYIIDCLRQHGHTIRIPQHCDGEHVYTERLDRTVKVEDGEPLTYEDILTEPTTTDMSLAHIQDLDEMYQHLDRLSAREQAVITFLYGLSPTTSSVSLRSEHTIAETAQHLSLSEVNVRKIYSRALYKLRRQHWN